MTSVANPPRIGVNSSVRLHDLGFRADGDEWIVGRMDSGDFIAIPDIGVKAVRLFQAGQSPVEARTALAQQTGADIDLVPFVAGLAAEGLVAEIDGVAVPGAPVRRPSLAWIKPHHVRWALHPVAPILAGLVICAAVIAVIRRPDLLPTPRDFVWSSYNSLVLIGVSALSWTMIFLHESAHLVTARAAGVPGRITLGTRLQFLVAQTNVTGIWLAPQRVRVTVYLAGIVVDLTVASLAILASMVLAPLAGIEHVLPVIIMLGTFPLVWQAAAFMRTDIYFVLQDLTRCRNLFGDATRYLRWQFMRVRRARPGRSTDRVDIGPDPTLRLPPHEQRIVRVYSWFVSVGVIVSAVFFIAVMIPVVHDFYAQTFRNIGSGRTLVVLDGVVGALVFTFLQGLWVYAFIRRRRERTAGHR